MTRITPVITSEMMSPCKKCAIGFDMLNSECHTCARYPGRKDNFVRKLQVKQ